LETIVLGQSVMDEGPSSGIYHVADGPSFFSLARKTMQEVHMTDPPLLLLYTFLVIWFVVLLRTRRRLLYSSGAFSMTCFFIIVTPKINAFMHEYWSTFRFRSNYFDMTCFFVFVFWSCPLILEAAVILLILIIDLVRDNWNEAIRALVLQWIQKKLADQSHERKP
jgi:hypothetical protein